MWRSLLFQNLTRLNLNARTFGEIIPFFVHTELAPYTTFHVFAKAPTALTLTTVWLSKKEHLRCSFQSTSPPQNLPAVVKFHNFEFHKAKWTFKNLVSPLKKSFEIRRVCSHRSTMTPSKKTPCYIMLLSLLFILFWRIYDGQTI